jgi:DNA mismatch repair protein MLH3
MSLLSVTSHHRLHHSHNTITMHKSTIVSRQTPSPPQLHLTSFSHGTRVTVRDLFGNMPVRVKQRAMLAERPRGNNKEWEELRRDIVLHLLAWPKSVAVTVREAATNEKLLIRGHTGASTSVSPDHVELAAICAILLQSSLISIEDKPFWVSARASTPKMAISAAISLIPSATKHTQFIAFGIQPLLTHDMRSILHDEINRMFLNSAFGNDEEVGLDASELSRRAKDKRYKGDGFTNKELKVGKKGVDRWPMFYINIQQDAQLLETTPLDIDSILGDKGSSLSAILELLQVLVWEFLTKHHFRPKADRGRRTRQTAHEEKLNVQDMESSQVSAELTTKMHSKPELCSTERTIFESRQRNPFSLAAHVKSPSSHQPSRSDAPFNAWTRVKSGSRSLKHAPPVDTPQISDASTIPRPYSAPPSSISRSSTLLPTPNKRPATPLLSSNGKLIRRPFEDVATPAMKERASTWKPPQPQENCSQPGEDLITWVNPATKIKSLVNQRTGLTLRADKLNTSNSKNVFSTCSLRIHSCLRVSRDSASNTDVPSPWLGNLLKTWNNPIFSPAEPAIPQVAFDGVEAGTQEILHARRHHCSQVDIDRAFKQSSAGIDGRISKNELRRAEVISQVDKKFILVKLKNAGSANTMENTLLVLIDQHAADERIRIESLLKEFFGPQATDTSSSLPSDIPTSDLDKAIDFEISLQESRLLCEHKVHFVRWGIIFDLPTTITQLDLTSTEAPLQRLTVRSLPPGIIERCKLDPKILIDLIRTEVWKVHDGKPQITPIAEGDWLQRIHSCPQGIIDMLNSRACRSAIMFNDELSKEQCQTLVSNLASCKFPFQCAHGRPSLVPLVNLWQVEMGARGQANNERLRTDLSMWKRNII